MEWKASSAAQSSIEDIYIYIYHTKVRAVRDKHTEREREALLAENFADSALKDL